MGETAIAADVTNKPSAPTLYDYIVTVKALGSQVNENVLTGNYMIVTAVSNDDNECEDVL